MNEVFLIGKVITDIEFKFIINSKHISIAKFKISILKDDEMVSIIAYDDMADYVYRMIQKGYIILINGHIKSDFNIDVERIEILKK